MYKVGSIREVEFIGWKDKKSRAKRIREVGFTA